jgi:Fe-S-cluster containining protein
MTSRADRATYAALDALYEQLPTVVDCKGLCANSCGPIAMSPAEHRRILDASGIDIPPATAESVASWARDEKTHTCPALTDLGRCSVHEIRPMICRLFGVVRGQQLSCRYGCRVDPGRLRNAEGLRFLLAAGRIGGEDLPDGLEGLLDDPAVAQALTEYVNQVPGSGDRLRALLLAARNRET